ncbi:hypothetical protein Sta7437_4043 [Stanieria cyanosphaera PCC 7437]|uniref:Uncharacterized protein n=2 Tax=Stanieria cyanosphaera TaxID=102116 RepID=K9XY40_STAC7|nr:hypothetical protein [Stanieria cyanosphaera]AFZ37520.1 hypothetical protein Sta7437_4043 [Stanieria cyanosphaera PCC 7437]
MSSFGKYKTGRFINDKKMRFLLRLIGLALLLLGIYFLGQNIYFTTNVYPYWWRGIAADTSILFLSAGVLMFFVLPSRDKLLSLFAIAIGIILIFASSRAILNPTSLWQFVLSLASFVGGYQLFTTGRLNI